MVKFYTENGDSPGVKAILNVLTAALNAKGIKSGVVGALAEESANDLIIPYGPKNSYLYLNSNPQSRKLALLVDYYSLGCKNKIFFYLKKGKLYYWDFWYSIISYFRYHYKEKLVAKSFDYVMLASDQDARMMSKDFKVDNIIVARNLIGKHEIVKPRNREQDKLVLGIISHWTKISVDETRWFIEDVFPKLRVKYPNIELKIAGRGDAELAKRHFRGEGVNFVGEVSNLDDYFGSLDVYVATVPKGCGVLNKLLDSFSYKVYSIGIRQSFSAFEDLQDGYVVCETADDFENAIELYLNNKERVTEIVDNAYNYVRKHNSSEENYNEVISIIEKEASICE